MFKKLIDSIKSFFVGQEPKEEEVVFFIDPKAEQEPWPFPVEKKKRKPQVKKATTRKPAVKKTTAKKPAAKTKKK